MAAVGDVEGNLRRLASSLRRLRYPAELDLGSLRVGHVGAHLPILHFCLLGHSRLVARWLLVDASVELHSLSDTRFVEALWSVCRKAFGYRPSLTPAQFLADGSFAEQKVIFTVTVAELCMAKHNELLREQCASAPNARTRSVPLHTAQRAHVSAARDAPSSRQQRSVPLEAVPGSSVFSRVERAPALASSGEPAHAPPPAYATPTAETTLDPVDLLQRLRLAEAALSRQTATIARLESRLRVLETPTRTYTATPPAVAAGAQAPAALPTPIVAESEQDLEAFMADVQRHFNATRMLLAHV